MYDKDIYVIDLETTNTLETTDRVRITQIGIVKLSRDGNINKIFESNVNPEEKLSDFIVKYTGLTDEVLSEAPKFYQLAPKLATILSDGLIAAWPINFEMPILQYEWANAGLKFPLDRRGIDIGSLVRYYMYFNKLPLKPINGKNEYSLDNCLNSLGLSQVSKRHSAIEDAYSEAIALKMILL